MRLEAGRKLSLFGIGLLAALSIVPPAWAAAGKPNIVVIWGDDI